MYKSTLKDLTGGGFLYEPENFVLFCDVCDIYAAVDLQSYGYRVTFLSSRPTCKDTINIYQTYAPFSAPFQHDLDS